MILNPEAVGDPNQTPIVYLGPGAAEVLGIRERTTPTIAERVAAGAKWLDEHRPGWVDRIDLDTLAVRHCSRCVLGQLFGDFMDAPQEVRLGAVSLGFESRSGLMRDYDDLTAAWRSYIQARRDNPMGVCEYCKGILVDPTAVCTQPDCQALTAERDAVLAGLVGKELDDE